MASIYTTLMNSPAVDEFIVRDRTTTCSRRLLQPTQESTFSESSQTEALIYSDTRLGRGQSLVDLSRGDALDSQLRVGIQQARQSLGPNWRLQPPAAPARVLGSDDAILRDSDEIADEVFGTLQSHKPSSVELLQAAVTITRETSRVQISNGFDNQKLSAQLDVEIHLLAKGGRPIRFQSSSRSLDIHWAAVLERESKRSTAMATAISPDPGECDLVLLGDCYVPSNRHDFGIWTALCNQSSAELARTGLARHQVGQSLRTEEFVGEELTLASDGTLDFGLRTAPFGDFGQPVRRFPIVTKMRASGQAMDYRDAAIAGGIANGGVRNLVIASGSKSEEELLSPTQRPMLVVHRIHEIHANTRGPISIQIATGEWRERDKSGTVHRTPIRSCVISGNIYSWLQNAFYSTESSNYHWYVGPKAIRFNNLRVQ